MSVSRHAFVDSISIRFERRDSISVIVFNVMNIFCLGSAQETDISYFVMFELSTDAYKKLAKFSLEFTFGVD